MREAEAAAAEPYWTLTLACLLGPSLWTVQFAVMYAASHFTCALATSADAAALVRWITGAITLITALPLVLLLVPGWFTNLDRRRSVDGHNLKFLETVARGLILLSLFGVIWGGVATLYLPACAGH